MKLTVYFDGQYWIGVIESEKERQPLIVRYLFGSEPSNQEILSFVQKDLMRLLERTMPLNRLERPIRMRKRMNAKRLRRIAEKELRSAGIGTKAQRALKEVVEQRKVAAHQQKKADKEALQERRYQLRREKSRQKHRGKA